MMNRSVTPFLLILSFGACATDEPVDTPDDGVTIDVGSQSTDMDENDAATTSDGGLDTGGGNPDATSGPDMDAPPDMAATADMAPTGDMDEPDISADMGQPAAGETCATAVDVTAGGTFNGDTTGANDDYSSDATADNCPSGSVSGGDLVYRLAPTAQTDYAIRVEPVGDFDPFIYVKADCAAAACIEGTVLNGPGDPESIQLTVPASSEYFVIVDGELLSEGEYTLIVTLQ